MSQVESGKCKMKQVKSSWNKSGRFEASRVDSKQVGSSRSKSGWVETSRLESKQVEISQVGFIQVEITQVGFLLRQADQEMSIGRMGKEIRPKWKPSRIFIDQQLEGMSEGEFTH